MPVWIAGFGKIYQVSHHLFEKFDIPVITTFRLICASKNIGYVRTMIRSGPGSVFSGTAGKLV
jgi:hypothetical protein